MTKTNPQVVLDPMSLSTRLNLTLCLSSNNLITLCQPPVTSETSPVSIRDDEQDEYPANEDLVQAHKCEADEVPDQQCLWLENQAQSFPLHCTY